MASGQNKKKIIPNQPTVICTTRIQHMLISIRCQKMCETKKFNGVARTLKKIRTSKGDYWNNQ